LLLFLYVSGCSDEDILLSEQVIESGLLEESVVTDVPAAVWEGIRVNQRYFVPKSVEAFQA
jgi:hypothetical protein